MSKEKIDYAEKIVNEKVLECLDKGIVPWKPNHAVNAMGQPRNLISNRPYTGINLLMIWIDTMLLNLYTSPYFASLKQIKQCGGRVKDEYFKMPTILTFWCPIFFDKETGVLIKGMDKTDYNNLPQSEKEKIQPRGYNRYYKVWNLDFCENINHKRLKELLAKL